MKVFIAKDDVLNQDFEYVYRKGDELYILEETPSPFNRPAKYFKVKLIKVNINEEVFPSQPVPQKYIDYFFEEKI